MIRNSSSVTDSLAETRSVHLDSDGLWMSSWWWGQVICRRGQLRVWRDKGGSLEEEKNQAERSGEGGKQCVYDRNPTCLQVRWRGWAEGGWFQRRIKRKWGWSAGQADFSLKRKRSRFRWWNMCEGETAAHPERWTDWVLDRLRHTDRLREGLDGEEGWGTEWKLVLTGVQAQGQTERQRDGEQTGDRFRLWKRGTLE